jgi:putative two-component system response regulator
MAENSQLLELESKAALELPDTDDIEDVEELEELGDDSDNLDSLNSPLASIEAFDPLEEIRNIGPHSDELDEAALDRGLEAIARQYASNASQTLPFFKASLFPFLALNNDLKIVSCNEQCRNSFSYMGKLIGASFFDVFSKAFQIQDVKDIREALLKGANNYSWKGLAQIKSRDRPTQVDRIYIYPGDLNFKNKPSEFFVMFDDVTEENKRLLRSVFSSLLEASKLKDNDTGKHVVRVPYYSQVLAEEISDKSGYDIVDADFIDDIGFLASMHDVGKIGTPDDILNKEGPLLDFEWTVMKEHTLNGAFILSTYPNPMAREIALNHHEKWNGKGYPYQIEGEMIPLAARIVSIADVYDALRMKRAYKPPFTHDVAVEKITESSGTQFDPKLVDVFRSISKKFNDIYEANSDA